jgi:hypothetical protein
MTNDTTNVPDPSRYCCICSKEVKHPNYTTYNMGKFVLEVCTKEPCFSRFALVKLLSEHPFKAKIN